MDKIILPEINLIARHGCLPEEKNTAQAFSMGLTLFLDLRAAGKSDDLQDTVDYGRLYLDIRELVTEKSFNLIEALAEAVAQRVLEEKLVEEVLVRLEKKKAVCEGFVFPACVELLRRREL